MIAQTKLLDLSWSEFGLAGLVIAVLFVIVVKMINWTLYEIRDQARLHREERREWRESDDKKQEGITKVITELTNAVQELGRRS